MDKKTLVVTRDTVAPGRALHYVFRQLELPRELEVSIVDRDERTPDLEVEACTDREGWIVIVLQNNSAAPVVITPLEPLRIVIFPRGRQTSLR